MARIGENAFRQYRDGQDRLTAPEYMAERELIRQAINDTEDKVERVEGIREEFSNTVNEVETVKGEVIQTKQEIETQIGEFSQTIDQTTQELQNKASKEEVSQVSTQLENKASKAEVEEVNTLLVEKEQQLNDIAAYASKFKTPYNDWGEAINAAINSIPNGKIIMPKGLLEYNVPIVLKDQISLTGAGKRSTRLLFKGTGNAMEIIGRNGGDTIKNVHLEDFTLSGTNSGNGIIVVCGSQITGSRIHVSVFKIGLYLSYSWVGSFSSCTFADCSDRGVFLSNELYKTMSGGNPTEDQNIFVFNNSCQFLSNKVGFEINGGINNHIHGCSFEGNHNEAVILKKPFDFTLASNYMEHNSYSGNGRPDILIDSLPSGQGYNISIKNNRIYGYAGNINEKANYGIDIVNGGINLKIEENSFSTHRLGHIRVGNSPSLSIGKNYYGDNNPKIVGNYDGSYWSPTGSFKLSAPDAKSAEIPPDYSTLFTMYQTNMNSKYQFKFIEYNGIRYITRSLNDVQWHTSLPSANEHRRGEILAVRGGTGVADAVYTCVKNATDAYEWKRIDNI